MARSIAESLYDIVVNAALAEAAQRDAPELHIALHQTVSRQPIAYTDGGKAVIVSSDFELCAVKMRIHLCMEVYDVTDEMAEIHRMHEFTDTEFTAAEPIIE